MLVAWLALSVVFALTPCCDVQAAPMAGAVHAAVPDQAAFFHGHTGGDDKPCAAWLDRNDALPVEAGILPTATPKLAIAVPPAFHLPPSPVTSMRQPLVASVFPPDALYLRYLRLIL